MEKGEKTGEGRKLTEGNGGDGMGGEGKGGRGNSASAPLGQNNFINVGINFIKVEEHIKAFLSPR